MHSSNQPDLRQPIADAVNELARQHGDKPEQKLPDHVLADHVSIACQRSWYGVETLNAKVNGGDFSACVVHVMQEESVYPWLFVLCRLPADQTWRPFMSHGGRRQRSIQPFLGKLIGPGTFVCVGGMDVVPDGGAIRIDLPDGSIHEEQARDECCVAFAPLTFPDDNGESVRVSYLDQGGNELRSETIRFPQKPA